MYIYTGKTRKPNPYPYPQNVLYEMGIEPEEVPTSPEEGIEAAIEQLSEQRQYVIKRFYKDRIRLCDIAKELNLTQSRIWNIRGEAIVSLIHRRRIIYNGITAETNYRETISRIKTSLKNSKEINDSDEEFLNDICVDDIGLKNSESYALWQLGFHSVGEVRGITRKDLLNIDSIGKYRADRIIEKLKLCHIYVKDE